MKQVFQYLPSAPAGLWQVNPQAAKEANRQAVAHNKEVDKKIKEAVERINSGALRKSPAYAQWSAAQKEKHVAEAAYKAVREQASVLTNDHKEKMQERMEALEADNMDKYFTLGAEVVELELKLKEALAQVQEIKKAKEEKELAYTQATRNLREENAKLVLPRLQRKLAIEKEAEAINEELKFISEQSPDLAMISAPFKPGGQAAEIKRLEQAIATYEQFVSNEKK